MKQMKLVESTTLTVGLSPRLYFNKNALRRKPISRFEIEIQIFTISFWNDFDLMTLTLR